MARRRKNWRRPAHLIYVGMGRRWFLEHSVHAECLLVAEYLRLHRGTRHPAPFSKTLYGFERREERYFVRNVKQQELDL